MIIDDTLFIFILIRLIMWYKYNINEGNHHSFTFLLTLGVYNHTFRSLCHLSMHKYKFNQTFGILFFLLL